MILLTKSIILRHVNITETTPIQEIVERLGLQQDSPKLDKLILELGDEGILEFIENERSVVRSTKSIKFPDDVYPNCQCRSETHYSVREYITGNEFWFYCGSCEASAYEGIPVYKIDQLPIPQSIKSDLLSKLEMDKNIQDISD